VTDEHEGEANEELDEKGSHSVEAPDEPAEFLTAVVLRPKPAFLEWVRNVRPPDEEVEGAMDSVVVLAPELPRQAQLTSWVEQHHEEIFARQLGVWTEDESRWPDELSFEALCAWFDIEMAAGVDDLRHRPLLPDVTCDPVSLKLLVAVFVGLPEDGTLYVDVKSGAVVGLSENDIAAMHAEEPAAYGLAPADLEQMRRVYESDTLVDVLGSGDVDELELMGSFADSQDIQGHRNRLLDALQGKKPRRQFKNAVEAAGLTERWEEWQASAVQAALRSALDNFRIPYVDDLRHEHA
jgi:hypothetical protein